jgi:hypothetical protein
MKKTYLFTILLTACISIVTAEPVEKAKADVKKVIEQKKEKAVAPIEKVKETAEKEKAAVKTPKAKTSKKMKDTHPTSGFVTKVSPTLISLKGPEGKPDREIKINADTKFIDKKKGQKLSEAKPATLSDVKVGKRIGGFVKRNADGSKTAIRINVGVNQTPAKKMIRKAVEKKVKEKAEIAPKQ